MNELVTQLKKLLELGKVDDALALEAHLYQNLVKPTEDEAHYFASFRLWQQDFEEAAKRQSWHPAKGKKVGFVFHSDSPMAHVKVVLKHCELRPANAEAGVFVLSEDTGQLRKLFSPLGVRVYYLSRGGEGVSIWLYRLRTLMNALGYGTLVWVSLPLWCSYAFGTRIAEKQVFWSQRFHPLISPNIDLYITPGRRQEKTRVFNGKPWKVCHTPLCLDVDGAGGRPIDAPKFTPVVGTIGRTEKIAHPKFLDAVVKICQASKAGFMWTGNRQNPEIQQALKDVPNEFKGWVEPRSFIYHCDVYLETFPLGGLSTFTAWEMGKPAVSLYNDHSPVASLDSKGLLTAENEAKYVELAVRALQDKALRDSVCESQRLILEDEKKNARSDVEKWWETVLS